MKLGEVASAHTDRHLKADSPAALAGVPLVGVPADVEGTLYDADTPALGAFAQ